MTTIVIPNRPEIDKQHWGQRYIVTHLVMAYTGRTVEELSAAIEAHPNVKATAQSWLKWLQDENKIFLREMP